MKESDSLSDGIHFMMSVTCRGLGYIPHVGVRPGSYANRIIGIGSEDCSPRHSRLTQCSAQHIGSTSREEARSSMFVGMEYIVKAPKSVWPITRYIERGQSVYC
jgi:hypothetical protein